MVLGVAFLIPSLIDLNALPGVVDARYGAASNLCFFCRNCPPDATAVGFRRSKF